MRDERTLKMMENYVELFDSGLGPKEIAERCGLSVRTVYNYVGEIAEKAGRSKDSLLRHPHDEHIMSGARNYQPVEPIDMTDFNKQLEAAITGFKMIKSTLDREIERTEESLYELEKEGEAWKKFSR